MLRNNRVMDCTHRYNGFMDETGYGHYYTMAVIHIYGSWMKQARIPVYGFILGYVGFIDETGYGRLHNKAARV